MAAPLQAILTLLTSKHLATMQCLIQIADRLGPILGKSWRSILEAHPYLSPNAPFP